MPSKFDRLLLERGGLKTDYININWLEIIGLASTHQTMATDFYQCLATHAEKFNTAMYGQWGRVFRPTLTSSEAKLAYTELFRAVGADLTLLILTELLRLCTQGLATAAPPLRDCRMPPRGQYFPERSEMVMMTDNM